jgi:hypothetical protein
VFISSNQTQLPRIPTEKSRTARQHPPCQNPRKPRALAVSANFGMRFWEVSRAKPIAKKREDWSENIFRKGRPAFSYKALSARTFAKKKIYFPQKL